MSTRTNIPFFVSHRVSTLSFVSKRDNNRQKEKRFASVSSFIRDHCLAISLLRTRDQRDFNRANCGENAYDARKMFRSRVTGTFGKCSTDFSTLALLINVREVVREESPLYRSVLKYRKFRLAASVQWVGRPFMSRIFVYSTNESIDQLIDEGSLVHAVITSRHAYSRQVRTKKQVYFVINGSSNSLNYPTKWHRYKTWVKEVLTFYARTYTQYRYGVLPLYFSNSKRSTLNLD